MKDPRPAQKGFPEGASWFAHRRPFLHHRATSVLPSDDYTRLESAFRSAYQRRSSTSAAAPKRSKNYDALVVPMNAAIASRFFPFFSEATIDFLSRLAGVPYLRYVDGALHSLAAGSRTGWIHTDSCPAWFDARSNGEGNQVTFPNRASCDYFTGRVKNPEADPIECRRAAALIYYLCNDDWRPGDGGETALYGSAVESDRTDTQLVPPINNTLLFFRCSPHSYHRFITNPGGPRHSLILWLHSRERNETPQVRSPDQSQGA